MDPTIALQDALDACIRNDKKRAADEFEALAHWLRNGGFSPDLEPIWESLDEEYRADEGQ